MNKELWNQMSFSQKIVWFVQYYGLTIVVVVVTIAVVLSLIKSFMNASDKGDMRIIILDGGASTELSFEYQEDISKLIDGEAEVAAYIKNDMDHMQAFSVRLHADDLDIVIAPEEEIREMAEVGYLLPYDPNGITSFYGMFPEELLLTMDNTDASKEQVFAVGFDENSRYMANCREVGAQEDNMYMGVTIKRSNDANIEKTALYFLEQ